MDLDTAPASSAAPQPPSRISPGCPEETAKILIAAAAHDAALLKKLLDEPGKANVRDPTSRETPLHAAVRSAAAASPDSPQMAAAKAAVAELLWSGAIWNDVDDADETPGCVALRLGLHELYEMCRDAGVRAEMLFALMDGYEALSSGSEDGDEADHQDGNDDGDDEAPPQLVDTGADAALVDGSALTTTTEQRNGGGKDAADAPVVESEAYLRSKVTYSDGKLVDDDGNGVMMAWETDIMRRSVDALLPGLPAGKRVLNIGFGMGIIDGMLAATSPARHHIIEAHPDVLAHAATAPSSAFGPAWEAAGPEPGAFEMLGGRWQDVCPTLLARGEVYDAIYFDTFGEDYSQLRLFFSEFLLGLLDADGRFGFFNGLGADRQICYDVYTRVAEMHLADAGLDVDWTDIDVDMAGLAEAGTEGWEGVRRRYWTLDKYRLPVCTFLG